MGVAFSLTSLIMVIGFILLGNPANRVAHRHVVFYTNCNYPEPVFFG